MNEQLQHLLTRARGLAIPIVAGLFLIVYAGIGLIYLQESQDQDSLQDQIGHLEGMAVQSPDISAELQAEYEEVQQAVTTEWTKDKIKSAILDIAADHGFDVSVVTDEIDIGNFGNITDDTVAGARYTVLPFALEISGDDKNVADFIDDMVSTATLPTMILTDISMEKGDTGTKATMYFSIYTKGP